MKFKYDERGKLYFDNTDPAIDNIDSNQFVGEYRYKQISEIKNAFEAAYLYKREGLYYLMWSFMGSENYNVRYAVADNITGPYIEINNSMTNPILERDDENNILGPGHHSVFDFDNRTFIAYHRQHYPFIDSKRQTCVDEMFFDEDGSIKKIQPTHKGVNLFIQENKDVNLSIGKQTLVSSSREYSSSNGSRRYRTYDIDFNFTGKFVTDENYGTRWDAKLDDKTPWIIIDLDEDCIIDRIETYFEFTSRAYKYKLEYLKNNNALDLTSAAKSSDWAIFADKSVNTDAISPLVDYYDKKELINARFVRLTILGVDNLPFTADDSEHINAENSLSVFELKVFGSNKNNNKGRIIRAENYYNKYGLELELDKSFNNYRLKTSSNNNYVVLNNLYFDDEVSEVVVDGIFKNEDDLSIEIYLDSFDSKPLQTYKNDIKHVYALESQKVVKLYESLNGKYDNIYIVFKYNNSQNSKNNYLNWIKFQ